MTTPHTTAAASRKEKGAKNIVASGFDASANAVPASAGGPNTHKKTFDHDVGRWIGGGMGRCYPADASRFGIADSASINLAAAIRGRGSCAVAASASSASRRRKRSDSGTIGTEPAQGTPCESCNSLPCASLPVSVVQTLNLARLPIPPLRHEVSTSLSCTKAHAGASFSGSASVRPSAGRSAPCVGQERRAEAVAVAHVVGCAQRDSCRRPDRPPRRGAGQAGRCSRVCVARPRRSTPSPPPDRPAHPRPPPATFAMPTPRGSSRWGWVVPCARPRDSARWATAGAPGDLVLRSAAGK